MFLKKPELYQTPDDAWENCVVEAEGWGGVAGVRVRGQVHLSPRLIH